MKELNNNIQEPYCSLEVSKLLEEKGCTLGENKDGLITHALAIEWIKQNYGSDKIKHIIYNWTSNQIDNELVLILEKCGNQ